MGHLQEKAGQLQEQSGRLQEEISTDSGRLQDKEGRLQEAKSVNSLPTQQLSLKKHVAAIHSANKLSLVQRKIANALLFNAYNDLLSKSEHKIHITALCELIGYNSHEQKAIKKSLVSLISTVIEWNLVDKDKVDQEGVWNASAIISDASIEGAVCTYSYSNKMRQLLYSPEVYGRLNMEVQAKFKSSYGLALYENCIRYQNIHETPWLDIPVFRKLMGVEEGKYAAFKDFRKRVIDIAVKEVNQHTNYDVDYLLKKAGRKVVAIKFKIHQRMLDSVLPSEDTKATTHRLRDEFGFSNQQITETMSTYEEAYILEKIHIVQSSSSYQTGKIANLAKYLLSALKDDYQMAKSTQAIKQGREAQEETARKHAREQESLKLEYDKYVEQQFREYLKALDENTQSTLMQSFENHLKETLYFSMYQRDGIDNAVVMRQLIQFMKGQGVVPELVSFEEFSVQPEVM